MRSPFASVRVALVLAMAVLAPAALAQQQPGAASLGVAKEIVAAKGGTTIYDSVLPGVVEQVKNMFLQQNPALSRDLNEVAVKLRTDLRGRTSELTDEIARLYALRFTEQELKDVLAFYKTPLGQKVISEEPKILDASVQQAQAWANKISEEVLDKMRAEMKKKGHDL